MKTILTALFAIISLSVLAAPPPPFFRNNYDTQACTYVFINCRGLITANNNTSIVVNSQWNTIDNANISANISGGLGNNIMGPGNDESVIGGGLNNLIRPNSVSSLISGGTANIIWDGSTYSFVGGGNGNIIGGANPVTFGTIAGGQANVIFNPIGPDSWSFIGGGNANTIADGPYNVIGGGNGNIIFTAQDTVIAGGFQNSVNPGFFLTSGHTIGGGFLNSINVEGGIVGYATISGGYNNLAFSNYCTVGGGVENFVYGLAGTIAGGGHNTIQTNSGHGFIGGGSLNQITNSCSYGVIAGGTTNMITNGFAGVISGGQFNRIDSIGGYCVIGGGYSNIIHYLNSLTATADGSTISGGKANYITASFASIGGGVENIIAHDVDDYGTIGGGLNNWVGNDFSTIAGGRQNTNSTGNYSFIMGGYSNRTEGAVTVAGGRSACAMADGTWMFKDNSSGAWSNNTANTLMAYFTGVGADSASIKLGLWDVLLLGTNRNFSATRSDGAVTPLIGLVANTNRIRSSGANYGVIFNNSSDTLLTRMDNNGNWGFKTNVPQRIIHVNGTGTNYAALWFSQVNTNKPPTPGNKVRYLAVILDDGVEYFIPLER